MSVAECARSGELPKPVRQDQSLRVAYLLKRYPRLSETFILHEMLALEARGMRLRVYALLDPAEATVHPDVDRLAAPVTYLPRATLAHLGQLARAHARLLRRDPHRYLQALRLALTRSHPLVGLRHLLRAGWLGLELEREGIRHLHAHFAHGPAATAQFVHALTGLPYSFTAHAKDIYTTAPARLEERIREACFVVTCTSHNHGYLVSLVDTATATRIHRIYHGVDLRRFRLLPPLTQGPPLILAVGRLVEKKGLSYLVEACAVLRDRGAPFRCLMVGGGPLRDQLRAQIAALGLEGTVELLSARTQEELVDIYRQATPGERRPRRHPERVGGGDEHGPASRLYRYLRHSGVGGSRAQWAPRSPTRRSGTGGGAGRPARRPCAASQTGGRGTPHDQRALRPGAERGTIGSAVRYCPGSRGGRPDR